MQALARNGYTADQVEAVLHGPSRHLSFRYELLDAQNNKKADLYNVLSASVAYNSLAEIKRTARFSLLDDGQINFLSDRIKPYVRLKMPETVVQASQQPTFARNSVAYTPDGKQVAANVPRYVAGNFGQAVMVEEGTTNLFANPLLTDGNADGVADSWSIGYWSNADDTATHSKFIDTGAQKLMITNRQPGTNGVLNDYNVSLQQVVTGLVSGDVLTISAELKRSGGTMIEFLVQFQDSNGVALASHYSSNTFTVIDGEDFKRFSFKTPAAPANTAKANCAINCRQGSSQADASFWIKRPQLEKKPYGTSFVSGTRSTETLTIPTAGVLNAAEGTFEGYVYIGADQQTMTTSPHIFRTSDTANRGIVYLNVGKATFSGPGGTISGSSVLSVGWHHFAMTWKGTVLKGYVDGSLIGTVTLTSPIEVHATTACLGGYSYSGGSCLNSLMDDVRISSIARSDAEIFASSKAPSKVDKYTTLKMHMDGSLTAYNLRPSDWVEFPQGVFILSTPPRKTDSAGVVTREVEAYDLLQVLMDDKVIDRYTVTVGTNYINAVKTLLDGAGITQRNLTATDKTLPADRDWEPGTTKLRIINDLLGAINYRSLWFDENGVAVAQPYVSPALRTSEYTYRDDDESVIFPEVQQSLDLFAVPNQWVLYVSEADRPALRSVFTNSNPASPTSTVSRGRTIVAPPKQVEAADQVTLDAMTQREAFETSQVYEEVDFETAIMPMHSDSDVYTLEFSALGLSAKYSETQWEFDLKAGARMRHRIRRVVAV